jgi:hypothetical protein
MGMKKIYVAGPYTAINPRDTQLNVNKAIEIGCALIKKGYAPFIPHLYHYVWLHEKGNYEYDTWRKIDTKWIESSNAFFYIGSSKGADEELKMAEKLGLPIYKNLDEVPEC